MFFTTLNNVRHLAVTSISYVSLVVLRSDWPGDSDRLGLRPLKLHSSGYADSTDALLTQSPKPLMIRSVYWCGGFRQLKLERRGCKTRQQKHEAPIRCCRVQPLVDGDSCSVLARPCLVSATQFITESSLHRLTPAAAVWNLLTRSPERIRDAFQRYRPSSNVHSSRGRQQQLQPPPHSLLTQTVLTACLLIALSTLTLPLLIIHDDVRGRGAAADAVVAREMRE